MKKILLILIGCSLLFMPKLAKADIVDDCNDPNNNCVRIHVDKDILSMWPGSFSLDNLSSDGINSKYTVYGYDAMKNISESFKNTAFGQSALRGEVGAHGGAYNTAIGAAALFNITYGYYDTAVGASSMSQNSEGYYNSAVGVEALRGNTDDQIGALSQRGHYNTAFGVYSLWRNTFGSRNTAIGTFAGTPDKNTQGMDNKSDPVRGSKNMTGSNNIFIGYSSGPDATDISNSIVIGAHALATNSNQMVVGSYYSTFLRHAERTDCGGYSEFDCRVGGTFDDESSSCTVGEIVTKPSTVYENNVPVTYQLESETLSCIPNVGLIEQSYWGSGVTSVDPQDFTFNATGGSGTDIPGADLIIAGGKSTGAANGGSIVFKTSPAGTSGSNLNALQEGLVINANGNVGIGTASPQAKLDVKGDIAADGPHGDKGFEWDSTWGVLTIESYGGQDALIVTDGGGEIGFRTGNLGMGTFTDDGFALYSNNNKRMFITNTGEIGIGTTSPTYPLEMASGAHVTTGGVWTDASSREYKENISELSSDKAIETLNGLNPVEFNYKVDKEEKYVGFIAEDVPELVATNNRNGLSPMDIVAVLTSVVKEQQKMMEKQQKTISNLSQKVNELDKEVKLKGSLAKAEPNMR